jgi:EmrB/QacA subfamily drug resistance transporter
MKQPCDEMLIRSGAFESPCQSESRPWILAAAILGSSMAFIDSTVVNVALPALQSNLHASLVGVQWVVECYGLFLSALILIGGALGDSVGRRVMFLLGVALFAAASVGCGLSSSVETLVMWRCFQGIGAACLVPGSLAIISASFDDQSRARAIGTWSGFTAITTALGPVLGGYLIEHASWHWVFFINVPLAAVVIAISWWHLPESRAAGTAHLDWVGALLATVGLAGLVYGLLESTRLGWGRPNVAGSLLLGLVSLLGFVLIEMRARAPMVPLSLFKSRTFSGANLVTLFLYSALGIFFFLFPLNLIQVQGYSATATGAAALPMILLMFFLSRWSGGLIGLYGPKRPLVIGPLIAAGGFVLFALPSVKANYWTTFFPAFVVLGLGMAISVAPLTAAVMGSVERERVGTASGINNAVARVAGVLAVAVFGMVMVKAFGSRLNHSLRYMLLPTDVLRVLQANEIKLVALQVPSSLSVSTAAAIRQSIAQAFVFAFRIVMVLCASLSLVSAALAWWMIGNASLSVQYHTPSPAMGRLSALALSERRRVKMSGASKAARGRRWIQRLAAGM